MIRRLVEAHYFQHRKNPNPAQVKFWFQELRTPELLTEVARANAALCRRLVASRPLLAHVTSDAAALESALLAEEAAERAQDKTYWLPLRRELEKLRRAK